MWDGSLKINKTDGFSHVVSWALTCLWWDSVGLTDVI